MAFWTLILFLYRKSRYGSRQSKKDEFEEYKNQEAREKLEDRPKKAAVDNPAAALVTQVPQGATKPVVDPSWVQSAQTQNFGEDQIVVGPSKQPGKKCLVLDLDETLVHSSFQPVENWDLVLPVSPNLIQFILIFEI